MQENEQGGEKTGVDIPPPFSDLPFEKQEVLRKRIYRGGVIVFCMVIVFVVGMLWYVSYKKQQATEQWESPGVPVKVMELKPTALKEVVESTGVIQPIQEVTVYPEVSGKVVAIKADLGDELVSNDPLVVIDDELIRLKVKQMQAQISKMNIIVEDSEKNLKRLKKLYRGRTVSETDLDQARLAYETNKSTIAEAEAALDMALYELRHAVVRSPINGHVSERYLEVGSLVSPQSPVAKMVNISRIRVEMGLVDEEINRVRVGQEAVLMVDVFPKESFAGVVTAVGSQADARSLTFPVRVELDNSDPQHRLLPGMIARLSIKVALHDGVIVIPREIIHEKEQNYFAWVVEDDQARKRMLTLGPYAKEMVVVTSGLSSGDSLVVIGYEHLHEGLKVRIDEG